MTPEAAFKPDEAPARSTPTSLSHSRISRYLACPEQYRLHYVEHLRPRVPSANLAFGSVVHQALARLFRDGEDPVRSFADVWETLRELDLTYSKNDTWEKLRDAGAAILAKFLTETAPRIGKVVAVEKPFEFSVTTLPVPVTGIVDLVAELDGVLTVVDFKTATSSYDAHEVALSDQLTLYRLGETGAVRVAFCVLVKTKTPKIEWYVATRRKEELTEYLDKVGYLARQIASGRFYKRPGMWCSWCDFLPVCTGDRNAVEETLIQIR